MLNRQAPAWAIGAMTGALLVVWATPAYAYIDPGAAGVVGQFLVAIIAAGGAVLAVYRDKVRTFINWITRKDKSESS